MPGQRVWLAEPVAALLGVLMCLSAPYAAGSETPPAAPGSRSAESIVVEAVGFATMEPGVTMEQAHERALEDARRNALNLALVDLEAQTEVVDRRVKESVVRVHTVGRVREINVSESGVVPGSDPPVYRVRLRAIIVPRPGVDGPSVGLPAAGWTPSVALAVASDGEDDMAAARVDALGRSISRCGVKVVQAGSAVPHLLIDVRMVSASAGGNVWTRVSWTVADPADRSADAAVSPMSGTWQVASSAAPDSPEWQAFGVRLAQDSVKVWLAPHTVRLEVSDLTKDDAEALVQALRRAESSRIERSLDDATVQADLMLAGSPVAFCGSLLHRAGVESRYAVRDASLTMVKYGAVEPESAETAAGTASSSD